MSDEQSGPAHCGVRAKNLGITAFDKWVYWCTICGAAAKAGEGEPLNWQAPSGGDGAGQDARPTSAALFSQLGISTAAGLQAYMQSLINKQMASERCETARDLCIATAKIEAEIKALSTAHDALAKSFAPFEGGAGAFIDLRLRMVDHDQRLQRTYSEFQSGQDEVKALRAAHEVLNKKIAPFDLWDRQSIANLNMRMEDVEQNLDRIFSAFKNSQDE